MIWQTAFSPPSGLGESPFWHPDEALLYWIDIPGQQLHRADPHSGNVQSWAMPSEPGCIAPARSAGLNSGLVIALRDGIYRARHWGGALELLAPAQHDPATTRFNDGKADPLGRFWAGTIYEPRDAAKAQLFALDCRGGQAPQLTLKAGDATTANGLAWSPDAATLYWADTPRHLIRAWNWQAEGNVMSDERVFHQWPLDAEGHYYVAMYEGGRLLKLSPAGELLAEWAVPAQCPTMPCFGGADLKTLYLTSARHGRPATELARLPDSGCIFSMPVEVPGLPVNFFLDGVG